MKRGMKPALILYSADGASNMIATNGLQYDIAWRSGLQTRLAAPGNRNGPAASIASRKGGIPVLADIYSIYKVHPR
jgi:hypothetical protein